MPNALSNGISIDRIAHTAVELNSIAIEKIIFKFRGALFLLRTFYSYVFASRIFAALFCFNGKTYSIPTGLFVFMRWINMVAIFGSTITPMPNALSNGISICRVAHAAVKLHIVAIEKIV